MNITGRSSTITNSFVNGIIPVIFPSEDEVISALNILGMNDTDVRCCYCGDKATEWDHLRPIVSNKRPTGYISELANLVPACSKCNQSKSGSAWREWIVGTAPQCPHMRGIVDLPLRIERLELYEKKLRPTVIAWESVIDHDLWKAHWNNLNQLHRQMREAQKVAEQIRTAASGALVNKPYQ